MTKPPTVRRSALVLGLACLLSLIAAPAMAQPERWSNPAPVNPMTAIIVFLAAPVLLAIGISLVVVISGAGKGHLGSAVVARDDNG